MNSEDKWNIGYVIGLYDGQNETLIEDDLLNILNKIENIIK